MIDVESQFPDLLNRSEDAVKSIFPLSTKKYVLEASNWRWADVGDHVRDDFAAHKKAKLADSSITAKLHASLVLKDLSGKVVDQQADQVLLRVPHVTAKNSYIVNGKELQTVNQLRLRPGLYTRYTIDNNIETFVNTSAAGTYRVILDRETGKLIFRVGSSSHFSLYTVLRTFGIQDGEMQQAWGKDIFAATANPITYPAELHKLFGKLRPHLKYPPSDDEAAKVIAAFLESKPLDPAVNQITVNESIGAVNGRALMAASVKCLDLSRGKVKPDDTESLAFKSIHSVEDFVPEKIKQALNGIKYAISSKLDRDPKIRLAVHPGMFSEPVFSFFSTSEFARHTDQSNPVEMVSTNFLTTTMGEGGIGSTHAVTDSVRLVHPSHIGILDPTHTPEGQKIGITGHLTIGAKKLNNKLALSVINAKTGKVETKTVQELDTSIIAFPDQYDLSVNPPKPLLKEIKGRQQAEVKAFSPNQVQYILRDPKHMFSATSNMIPFLHNNDGNRVGMADRHIEQTIPLKNPDKPLVQAAFKGNIGYEEAFGEAFLPQSKADGVVSKITPDFIEIVSGKQTHKVPLHNRYPLNSNTYLHDTPTVAVGDKVKAGQTLAENNFTNQGSLAMGKNLRIAYMPYKGKNFEDGIVISETAAKKLTSIHKYEHRLDKDSSIKVGLDTMLAHFPDQADKLGNKSRYGSDGIIKKGATVNHGDLLIPAVQEQKLHEDYDYARLHRALSNSWSDRSIYWDHDHKGKVMDVISTPTFVKVLIETEEQATIGDKISMRHGGKGIITTVLPDNEMYRDEKNEPLDVLFNPTGVPGRVNPGQMFEAAAGKLAKTTGKTYVVKNFGNQGPTLDKIQSELRSAGINENAEETVTDPETGRQYPGTLVGDTHFFKLKHMVSKKFSARGVGGQYTVNEQPSKQDEESAQRIGGLELYALLSGDATHFVKDAFEIKGQKNDEYWRALQLGLPLPKPATPFVSEKFNTYLLGAGINLQRHGDQIKALPMTDKQILAMSNGEIKEPTVVTANDLKPEKGGLFDPAVTGGIGGSHWAHIELPEPIVNPLMTKPVMALLDLTTKQFEGLMDGSYGVASDGDVVPNVSGKLPFGGEAIKTLLGNIDVNKELIRVKSGVASSRSVIKRDKLNKVRRYLEALKTTKLSPVDAYMNKYVSVVPPKFRSVYPLPDGSLNVSDPVHGYREVLLVSNALRDMKNMNVDQEHVRALRGDLFKSVSGLVGLTEPLTREAHFKGFLSQIKGVANKRGFFQDRVMSRSQDLSARSTVIPDPKLNMDEVGIPEKMGLAVYKPFLVRRLVSLGHDPLEAREMVENGDPLAVKALHIEAQERPVIMNRAPSLHKFNMMAFKPRIVPGQAIQVNPLIVGGYNMDFDGDTVGIHVPVTEAARTEALEKLLPSRNLFSPASNRVMHLPSMETTLGLYLMSEPKGEPIEAVTEAEMVKAYQEKKAQVNTAFKIGGKLTCPGQALINQVLPAKYRISGPMTKKVMTASIEAVARGEKSTEAARVVNMLKDLGNHYVTEVGFSVSLKDLHIDRDKRDAILDKAKMAEKSVGFEAANRKAVDEITQMVHANKDNRFVILSTGSGALAGKANSVDRLVATPVAVTDHRGQAIPVQIRKSYAEGHDMGSYWATLPGARKGMMDKGLSTADTGYLTKLLVQTGMDNRIVESDCGTTEGVPLLVGDPEIVGRVGTDGTLYTHEIINRIIANKDPKSTVSVRSPLTCKAKGGLCQKCFGLNETGQFYPIGFHIGILAAQTIGEPSTQLALKNFHTGGALGGGKNSQGFARVRELFSLPENIKNKATLAMVSGTVKSIKPGKAGGWLIDIDGTPHYVPHELGLAPSVVVGGAFAAGDQLSASGVFRPQDMLDATGDIHRVRSNIINELDNNFKSSGVNIKRRIFETVVKPMTDRATVIDAGDGVDAGVHVGDIVSINRITELNKNLKNPIKYEASLFGVSKIPHLKEDFVGRLMHERLMDTMRDAAALNLTANIGPHGHPVTQLSFIGSRNIGAPSGRP